MKVSIIIPCYNEERTLAELLRRVLAAAVPGWEKEVILVDDGSRDGSLALAQQAAKEHPATIHVLALATNSGKGAAVRAGLAIATGEVFLVQDADLEYDPNDYATILAPFADPAILVVYGSRILGGDRGGRSHTSFYWGGRLVTAFTNLLFGSRLTDEPTCYKAFRRSLLPTLALQSRGFEFCAELTGQLLRQGQTIHEVPIRYNPRRLSEGKKIRWQDGVRALWTLLRHRFQRP